MKILILFLLIGCGKDIITEQATHDPAFDYIRTRVVTQVHLSGHAINPDSIKIIYSDVPEYADCVEHIGQIRVSKSKWDFFSDDLKELYVLHEYGHCVLHKPHNDATNNIMNSIALDLAYYQANKTELIQELFE